jgi:tRNA 2-thiouridine synthesizing protein A
MPVVRVGQALNQLGQGQVLKVIATDRGAIADIPAWAEDTENEVVDWHDEGSHLVFYVRKGGDPAAH